MIYLKVYISDILLFVSCTWPQNNINTSHEDSSTLPNASMGLSMENVLKSIYFKASSANCALIKK